MRSWSRFEVLILGFALVIAALCLGLLLFDSAVNQWRSSAETPVGTLVFKFRTAEAMHRTQTLWMSLPQNAPVFNHDTIRTAAGSSAELVLDRGSRLSLEDQTMVRIDWDDQRESVRFLRGKLRVSGRDQRVKINSSGDELVLNEGEALVVQKDGLSTVSLVSGSGTLVTARERVALKAGVSKVIGKDGLSTDALPTALGPEPDALIYTADPAAQVELSWLGAGAVVMVGRDPSFQSEAKTYQGAGLKTTVTLAPGVWWWGVGAPNQGPVPPASRKLEVRRILSPRLIKPLEGETSVSPQSPSADLRWTPVPQAQDFLVEVASDPGFHRVESSVVAFSPSVTLPVPGTGIKYARVTARIAPPYAVQSVTLGSEVRSFTVSDSFVTKLRWTGTSGSSVSVNPMTLGSRNGTLRWQDDGSGVRYQVRVAHDPQITQVVRQDVVSGGSYTLPSSLKEGLYYLEVKRMVDQPQAGLTRKVAVVGCRPPEPLSPQGAEIGDFDQELEFTWTDPNQAPHQVVELSATPDFQKLIARQEGFRGRGGISEKVLFDRPETSGGQAVNLYWRVVDSDENRTAVLPSRVVSFLLPSRLTRPQPLAPQPAARVDLFKSDRVIFAWGSSDQATGYRLNLVRTVGGFPVTVRSFTTKVPRLVWDDFLQLTVDTYTWELTAVKIDSSGKLVSRSRPAKSVFRLDQSAKVKAVKMKTSLIFSGE